MAHDIPFVFFPICYRCSTYKGIVYPFLSRVYKNDIAAIHISTFYKWVFKNNVSLQVMFLVAFIACILKKPALDEEDTNEDLNNVIAAHDEEFIGKDNGTIEGL